MKELKNIHKMENLEQRIYKLENKLEFEDNPRKKAKLQDRINNLRNKVSHKSGYLSDQLENKIERRSFRLAGIKDDEEKKPGLERRVSRRLNRSERRFDRMNDILDRLGINLGVDSLKDDQGRGKLGTA